jgi:hypothetical protein
VPFAVRVHGNQIRNQILLDIAGPPDPDAGNSDTGPLFGYCREFRHRPPVWILPGHQILMTGIQTQIPVWILPGIQTQVPTTGINLSI